MISDVLSDAVSGLDYYLNSDLPLYQEWYSGKLREEITIVRNTMDALRAKLDNPHSEEFIIKKI